MSSMPAGGSEGTSYSMGRAMGVLVVGGYETFKHRGWKAVPESDNKGYARRRGEARGSPMPDCCTGQVGWWFPMPGRTIGSRADGCAKDIT